MTLREALDAALIEAHENHDRAALIRLYTDAANTEEAAGRTDAACFFLTHAYVFALEAGAAEARALNARLYAYGREPKFYD